MTPLLLAVLLQAGAAPDRPPSCEEQLRSLEAERGSSRGGAPTAVLTAQPSFCIGLTVLRFHGLRPTSPPDARFALVRTRMDARGRIADARIDTASCPALSGVLARLSGLMVTIDLGDRPPAGGDRPAVPLPPRPWTGPPTC